MPASQSLTAGKERAPRDVDARDEDTSGTMKAPVRKLTRTKSYATKGIEAILDRPHLRERDEEVSVERRRRPRRRKTRRTGRRSGRRPPCGGLVGAPKAKWSARAEGSQSGGAANAHRGS